VQLGLTRKSALSIIGCAVLALSTASLVSQDALALTPAAFETDPGQVLTQNANGGPQLATLVRSLAVSDPATLSAIIGLLPNANKDQKAAIAAGLAQAAKIEIRINPAFANDIQQAIAKTKDQDVVLAFAAASGDQPIGATGGGGPAGGSGGQTSSTNGGSSGGGSLQSIGSSGVNTGNFAISSSVSGTSGTTGSTSSGTNAISNSVSP
jgi:hypothetical protein